MHDLWFLRDRFKTWKLLLGNELWDEHFLSRLRELDDRLNDLEANYLILLEDVIIMRTEEKERREWTSTSGT